MLFVIGLSQEPVLLPGQFLYWFHYDKGFNDGKRKIRECTTEYTEGTEKELKKGKRTL